MQNKKSESSQKRMKSVSHTKSFQMNVAVDKLFPLFTPEGETYWVPGWDYENIMGNSKVSEDYIFLTKTHDHATTNAIWIVKNYDHKAYLVQYYKIEPEDKIGIITVKCKKLDIFKTEIHVTYKYIALSATGEKFISSFDENAYSEFIKEWETLLSKYFKAKS